MARVGDFLPPTPTDVAEWHTKINDILDGKKTLDKHGNVIPRPGVSYSAIIPPVANQKTQALPDGTLLPFTGQEQVGTVKSVRNALGQEQVYRLQQTGKWELMDSSNDEYAGTAGERKEVEMPTVDSNLIPMAEVYLDNAFNVLLLGLHGTGKTASIMDIAKKRNIKMKYYSCATLDPFTDLVGVPYPYNHCETHGDFDTRKEHHDLFPDCQESLTKQLEMVRPHDVDEAEIIFFDEFNRADPKTMNAVFEIIQFRTINGQPLPNLKACWAAMNPPDEDYEVEKLDPALVDRFDVYIDIQPKPSVSYMAQYMPEDIAKALKIWWDEHERKIKGGTLNQRIDYVSPRRLLKIGLVWCATKNARSVNQSLPLGGTFDRNKLSDYLKAAQKQIDQREQGIEPTEADPSESTNVGDRPNKTFIYQPANLRMQEAEVVKFLSENPLAHETHNKVAAVYKQGVGGPELVLKHGKIINALSPSVLEALVASFPAPKQVGMRDGFKKLYQDNPAAAKDLKHLHTVLKAIGRTDPNFPQTL